MKKNFKETILGSVIFLLCLFTVSCNNTDEPVNTDDWGIINSSTEITEAGDTEAENTSAETVDEESSYAQTEEPEIADVLLTDSPSQTETENDSTPPSTEEHIFLPNDFIGMQIPLVKYVYHPDLSIIPDNKEQLNSTSGIHENVLGTTVEVHYYFCSDWIYKEVTDTKTNELLFNFIDDSSEGPNNNICINNFDINGDGTNEIFSESPEISRPHNLILEKHDTEIYCVDLDQSLEPFFEKFSLEPSRIECRFRDQSSIDNYIRCFNCWDNGTEYQKIEFYFYWNDTELVIREAKAKTFSRNLKFTSNDPRYSAITVQDAQTRRYTQYIYVDDKLFTYDLVQDTLFAGLYFWPEADISHPRQLIAHPSLPYFVLIAPHFGDSIGGAIWYSMRVLSSETGEVLTDFNELRENIASEIYNSNQDAVSLLDQYDKFNGATLNRLRYDVSTTDTGFHYSAFIDDPMGNILMYNLYEGDIDLTTLP